MESSITLGVEVPENVTGVTSVTDDGKGVDTSSKRGRRRDNPPRSKPRKRAPRVADAPEVSTDEIQQALTELLSLPAIPCGMVGDEWAASHFLSTGPAFAEQLAKQADKNPAIRKWCIRLTQGESAAVLLMSGMMYVVPPLLHWGIIPAPPEAKAVMGVPVKTPDNPIEDAPGDSPAHPLGNTSNGSNGVTQVP